MAIMSQKLKYNEKPEYIVGIGASAGGIEALERFFYQTCKDNRLAYVVIQHLSPNFKSLMSELLAPYIELDIVSATQGLEVKANTVYLIPPKMSLTIANGQIHLVEQQKTSKKFVAFSRTFFVSSLFLKRRSWIF